MKGRTSNSLRTNRSGYATGGTVSGGASASAAPVARAKGGSVTVSGKAARPSLARPGRKVRRDDGGRVRDTRPSEYGFSDDPDAPNQLGPAGLLGAGIGTTIGNVLARRLGIRNPGAISKGLGYGATGAGGVTAVEEAMRRQRRDNPPERAKGGAAKKGNCK